MKALFLTLFLFMSFASISHGKSLEIDSKIIVEGKKLGSPRILTDNGERAKIRVHDQIKNKGYNLEVLPVLLSDKKILLKYSLAVQEPNHETLSRGQVRVRYDKKGLISIDKGKIKIHFTVKKA